MHRDSKDGETNHQEHHVIRRFKVSCKPCYNNSAQIVTKVRECNWLDHRRGDSVSSSPDCPGNCVFSRTILSHSQTKANISRFAGQRQVFSHFLVEIFHQQLRVFWSPKVGFVYGKPGDDGQYRRRSANNQSTLQAASSDRIDLQSPATVPPKSPERSLHPRNNHDQLPRNTC